MKKFALLTLAAMAVAAPLAVSSATPASASVGVTAGCAYPETIVVAGGWYKLAQVDHIQGGCGTQYVGNNRFIDVVAGILCGGKSCA